MFATIVPSVVLTQQVLVCSLWALACWEQETQIKRDRNHCKGSGDS